MRAIINAKAIVPDEDGNFFVKENAHVLYEEKIEKIFSGKIPQKILNLPASNIIDVGNNFLSPGFINIHIHGALGMDAMDEDEIALKIIGMAEASMGVTSFLPTTMTYDMDRVRRALTSIRNAMKNRKIGAKILGAHMEGPYISEKRCGAQAKENVKEADFSDISKFTDIIKIITLAPEVASDKFVKKAKKYGIVLSIGHSDASYEEAIRAIYERNFSHVTHLYNAMTPFHHRKPGIVGAAFDTAVTAELIADNIHVSPAAQRIAYKIKGIGQIILITDSIRASCLGEGKSELGGQEVFVKGEEARLKDGTLAGSLATMNSCLANFKKNTGAKIEETIETVTKNPAKSLNVYGETGSLETGKSADFTVFDENFNIFFTITDGQIVFENKKF